MISSYVLEICECFNIIRQYHSSLAMSLLTISVCLCFKLEGRNVLLLIDIWLEIASFSGLNILRRLESLRAVICYQPKFWRNLTMHKILKLTKLALPTIFLSFNLQIQNNSHWTNLCFSQLNCLNKVWTIFFNAGPGV